MNKQYYIIRGDRSGVFFGRVKERDGQTVTLEDVRKLWSWVGACAVEQIALDGVVCPEDCKFTVTVPSMVVTDAIQIIPCSDKAVKILMGVPAWKR